VLHQREREREFIRGSKRVKGPWCLIHEGGEVVEEEEDEEEDEEKLIQYRDPICLRPRQCFLVSIH